MCRDNSHNLLKYCFVFACALYLFLCNMSQICFKMAIFLFSADFGGHLCYTTIATVKNDARLLHFGYCSYKLIQGTCEGQLLFFDLIGGPK